MTAVIVAVIGMVLLLALALAVAWQERRRALDRTVTYGVEESIEFVRARLGAEARAALGDGDVRRILEWSIRYLQDPAVREGGDEPPVAGGFEAAHYIQDRAFEMGFSYDGELVGEVLAAQVEFLAALGAVGDAVGGSGHVPDSRSE